MLDAETTPAEPTPTEVAARELTTRELWLIGYGIYFGVRSCGGHFDLDQTALVMNELRDAQVPVDIAQAIMLATLSCANQRQKQKDMRN